MKYYVHYDYGYVREGDHHCGLDEFETLDEARDRVEELKVTHQGCEGGATIIYGENIT